MIVRRQFLVGSAAAMTIIPTACTNGTITKRNADTQDIGAKMNDDPSAWLGETNYIDFRHPNVAQKTLELTSGLSRDTEKARAVFDFVSTQIKFGFARGFWDNKASDVLASGRGYCNTKSTLFVALLRACSIPARQVFVDIDARVLTGITSPGTTYVDHSYVDVFLGKWVATDAYIVDPPLFAGALRKLKGESSLLGYSIHRDGTPDWSPNSPTFSQYDMNNSGPISTRVWGAFADVGDFYTRAQGTNNKLNPALRVAMGALSGSINARADAMRN